MISLQPMTPEYYEHFMREGSEFYVQDRARNFDTTIEWERETAARHMEDILPNGRETEGHSFWMVRDEAGDVAGHIWAYVDHQRKRAFIYDIRIAEGRRGQGIGMRTLQAVEEKLKPLGVTHIGLNVFGDNAVARGLYQKMGYRTTSSSMLKAIVQDPA